MLRYFVALYTILALASFAGTIATGQTIPPPVHLPIVRNGNVPATPTQTATASPTPTSTATFIVLPTVTDTPSPTPTAVILPTPTATISTGPCPCSADTRNCGDFDTQSDAQACFDFCVAQGAGDIHRLDQDNDGVACESLPFGWRVYEDSTK